MTAPHTIYIFTLPLLLFRQIGVKEAEGVGREGGRVVCGVIEGVSVGIDVMVGWVGVEDGEEKAEEK